ncbi:uncharacterized protein LOC124455248 [Xenia sp. Carnegie-2017]|uniref:uncharacterized protein LOC124455248 n=1 Tax=Xenia sp. Carnegie-2017 TaxID=2897299 RepID=UPI001F0373DB|nr:uncharacterized protein LOC124455248 [Xenia sp. Carnegie-2017]
MPYCIVGDEAFPLKTWIMRPYPGKSLDCVAKKVFNYRLSRARRTIENTFGIMVSKWRILKTAIVAEPNNMVKLTKAICVLHNFLRKQSAASYTPPGSTDTVDENGQINEGSWRAEMEKATLQPIAQSSRNQTKAALRVREDFACYFMSSEGELSWQVDYVLRTS